MDVVDAVVDRMGEAYPELPMRREHLLKTTRAEEERFLSTIEGGLARFEELAPVSLGRGTGEEGEGAETSAPALIPGEEAFRLYDTFGFPLDLTELMARERGYAVDEAGFEAALAAQRARSRADRAQTTVATGSEDDPESWTLLRTGRQEFVGYETRDVETDVLALKPDRHWPSLKLERNPFYLEAGGQVSDHGRVEGRNWAMEVREVRRLRGQVVVSGPITSGSFPADTAGSLRVRALVASRDRHDTERNHTATHLCTPRSARCSGEHVVQRGSLVAPDRLRFDFAHMAPLSAEEREEVEAIVNRRIWEDHPVEIGQRRYRDAVEAGAMALFGEKYGDEVRVVHIPGVSMELCGGTHIRHTGEIGLFRIVSESGVAAGVRRIEAFTGPGAFPYLKGREDASGELAGVLRTQPDNLVARVEQLVQEKGELEELLAEVRKGGGGGGEEVIAEDQLEGPDGEIEYRGVRLRALSADDVRDWGDGYRSGGSGRVAVVAAELGEGKYSLFAFVSDDLIPRGVRADALIKEVAGRVGGRGGGRPHLAQAGVGDPALLDQALRDGSAVVRDLLAEGS